MMTPFLTRRGLSARDVVMGIALAFTLFSPFLAWVDVNGFTASAISGDIRLRLDPLSETKGILNVDNRTSHKRQDEDARKPIDLSEVALADRRHLHNLPVDELDAVIFSQNSCFTHLVILEDREQTSFGRDHLELWGWLRCGCRSLA